VVLLADRSDRRRTFPRAPPRSRGRTSTLHRASPGPVLDQRALEAVQGTDLAQERSVQGLRRLPRTRPVGDPRGRGAHPLIAEATSTTTARCSKMSTAIDATASQELGVTLQPPLLPGEVAHEGTTRQKRAPRPVPARRTLVQEPVRHLRLRVRAVQVLDDVIWIEEMIPAVISLESVVALRIRTRCLL
jgi:hypothetical protein